MTSGKLRTGADVEPTSEEELQNVLCAPRVALDVNIFAVKGVCSRDGERW